MKQTKISPGEINGFLDQNTTIAGELRFHDTFRVDGKLSGKIVSENVLIVGESAEVSADIEVGCLTIMGSVSGTVKARERIELHTGGRLEADVITPVLAIAEGAVFRGHCDMSGAAEAEASVERDKPELAVVAEAPR